MADTKKNHCASQIPGQVQQTLVKETSAGKDEFLVRV